VKRWKKRFDAYQQAHVCLALPVAVVQRYRENLDTRLAALVTFYGFLSVFPLLLLLVTIAGLFLQGTNLNHALVNSALAQFPIIGGTLKQNLHAIARGNVAAGYISIFGILAGAFGVTNALQMAAFTVWRRPLEQWPGLVERLRIGLKIFTTLGLVLLLSSAATGVSTFSNSFFGGEPIIGRAVVLVVAFLINAVGYLAVLRFLAPRGTGLRNLLPGTVVGALGWTILSALSGYLLGHKLQHASQIYGFFAVVLGLVFWINLGAHLFLVASETNVVVAERAWPVTLRRL